MPQFDTVLKELILQSPSRLLEQLAGSPIREWLNVELPRTRNARVDLVAWLEDGRLWHLELQSENDDEINWRSLEYYLLIYRQMNVPPVQVTLYVGEQPLRMSDTIIQESLQFRHRVVDIRGLDVERLLESEDIGDNLMSILCRLQDKREVVRRILRRISAMPKAKQPDALARLLVLSGLRGASALVIEESKTMPVIIDPMKNPVLREWYEEAFARGQEQGREQGWQQGREQGKEQATDNLLRRLLEQRFGPLPEWAQSRLDSSNLRQREAWALCLLDARSLEEALGG
jgi:predicted transposase YdaD